MNTENPHAGQGPVLLDIGGDIGALLVTMPAELEGVEIEIRPVASFPEPVEGHGHSHGSGGPEHVHLPHVAVVPRPLNGRYVHSLVFPELTEGRYELYERPAGPVELTVTIVGGEVADAVWPSGNVVRH